VFTPLLVWPTLSRPWVLLAAMGAGACVQVASVLVMSWSKGGWLRNEGAVGFSGFGQLQWQLHCAVTICAAGVRWLPARARWVTVPALAASLFVVERGSRRLALVSAATATSLIMLRPRLSLGRRGWAIVGIVVAGVVAFGAWSGAARRSISVWSHAARTAAGDPYSAMNAAMGSRLVLAHAALDMGLQHPMFGNGRGSYKPLLQQWANLERTAHPERASAFHQFPHSSINDAHNALLNAFAEGGVPAALLLGTALLGTGWRLWRRARTAVSASVAFALYSAILLGMVCQPVTAKAPGAIIAVCLAISGIDRRAD
jgi:hypothetical protein